MNGILTFCYDRFDTEVGSITLILFDLILFVYSSSGTGQVPYLTRRSNNAQSSMATRRFLGMTNCLSYQSENCRKYQTDKLVDVLWILEASGKLFRWFFSANMFTGMSSQLLVEKFAI